MIVKLLSIILVLLTISVLSSTISDSMPFIITFSEPTVNDPSLKVEKVFDGLKFPTSMAFLEDGDILALEKNEGKVMRISNGSLQEEPLLDVDVATQGERGMLGIALSENKNENATFIFLFFTQSRNNEGKDICPKDVDVFPYCRSGYDPLGNMVYRYQLDDKKRLVNPKLC